MSKFKKILPDDTGRPTLSLALTPAQWKIVYNALLLDQLSNDTTEERISTILEKIDILLK